MKTVGFILLLVDALQLEVAGREPLAEPRGSSDGGVGGDAVVEGDGLGEVHVGQGYAVPPETITTIGNGYGAEEVVVGRQFVSALGMGQIHAVAPDLRLTPQSATRVTVNGDLGPIDSSGRRQ